MEYDDRILEEALNQVLEIAAERTRLIERLKQALIENDCERIKDYANRICGLTNESNRVSKGINTRTER